MPVFQAKAWIQALAIYFEAICFSFLCTNWTILDSFQAHSCFLTGNPEESLEKVHRSGRKLHVASQNIKIGRSLKVLYDTITPTDESFLYDSELAYFIIFQLTVILTRTCADGVTLPLITLIGCDGREQRQPLTQGLIMTTHRWITMVSPPQIPNGRSHGIVLCMEYLECFIHL